MRTRTKLLGIEFALSTLEGVMIMLWLLNIATLQIMVIFDWCLAQFAIIFWFKRTDEIDHKKEIKDE